MNFVRNILVVVFSFLAVPALAACEGDDIRDSFTPEEPTAIEAELAATPYSEGNHWVATKGDRQIHFVGTMHFNDPRMGPVVDRLAPIIETADAVLFETAMSEMEAFQTSLAKDWSPVLITDGPTLPELMSEEGWAKLSEITRSKGIPSWMAAKMRPWFLSSVLAVPACLRNSPNPDHGLDRRLGEVANAFDIPEVSLEAIETMIALFDKYPIEEQVRMVEMTLDLMGGSDNDMYTMAKAYFEERSAEAMLAMEMSARRESKIPPEVFEQMLAEFRNDILIQRNINWIPVNLNQSGNRIFVAVGAAHLSGEFGVLRLIENEGYTLRRARF